MATPPISSLPLNAALTIGVCSDEEVRPSERHPPPLHVEYDKEEIIPEDAPTATSEQPLREPAVYYVYPELKILCIGCDPRKSHVVLPRKAGK